MSCMDEISTAVVDNTNTKKKFAMSKKGLLDNLRDHEVAKSFANGNVCESCHIMCDYFLAGGDLNARDSRTGETFLHILCDYIHLYLSPNGTRLLYMLSTKLDLGVRDTNGDTALHKVVRVPGAWRCIVALMRNGSCPLIKNNAGRSAEEEILHWKNEGWEENLHWLRKFMPGLWNAVKCGNPDLPLIERLLRYWCRTTRIIGTEAVNLKYQVHMCEKQLDTVYTLEKYENTNEMALAMLSGKSRFINIWKLTDNLQKVDINTKDHSYQFCYRDYPTAPRPLLAAIWEIGQLDLIQNFMELRPDTSVMYTFESEATSPPKPLFFQLVNPKSRPQDEEVARTIFRDADLNIRNIHGQTVLVEAMYNGETEGMIRIILSCGVNVGARDNHGRTARDHCEILKRNDYRELIDSHIIELVEDCDIDRLEGLVLHMYDGIFHASSKCKLISMARQKSSKQLNELLKNVESTQSHIKKLYQLVKDGNKAQLLKSMSRKYACAMDKAGRSLLHYAIQHCCRKSSSNRVRLNSQDSNTTETITIDNDSIDPDDISVRGVGLDRKMKNSKPSDLQKLTNKRNYLLNHSKKENLTKSRRIFLCPKKNFTPDHKGIIEYFLKEYPLMLGTANNLGQTPLHYVYIYSASKDIEALLKQAGASTETKDVFDFVPEDYDCQQCGKQTYEVRRKSALQLDLDIFLTESDFESKIQRAVEEGNMNEVKTLVVPLLEHDGEHRFSSLLFDSLDRGYTDLAMFLVECGFPTDVSKQYEVCDPDDPMCAMMECGHTSTTFRQRAQELGATKLVNLIDSFNLPSQNSVIFAD